MTREEAEKIYNERHELWEKDKKRNGGTKRNKDMTVEDLMRMNPAGKGEIRNPLGSNGDHLIIKAAIRKKMKKANIERMINVLWEKAENGNLTALQMIRTWMGEDNEKLQVLHETMEERKKEVHLEDLPPEMISEYLKEQKEEGTDECKA